MAGAPKNNARENLVVLHRGMDGQASRLGWGAPFSGRHECKQGERERVVEPSWCGAGLTRI